MAEGKNPVSLRNINKLAVPAILSGIAEPIISLADTAFVGRIGTTELAAVGIAGSFYLMMVWILSQTLTAIAAIVSRHYGSGDLEGVKTLVPQAILSNLLLGLGVFAITNVFSTEIFQFYNASGPVLEACEAYFGIRSFGFPFTLATMLLFGAFRGLQNTHWAMVIALTGAVVNLVLDYILIFEWNGNGLGLEGAAIASLIAQITMFLMAIGFLLARTPFPLLPKLPINPQFKWLARMSGDLFVRTIMLNLTFYLATRYATGYGEEVIAAHTIALNIWLFSSFFIDGYAHAGNAISGALLGRGQPGSIGVLGVKILKISAGIGTALALIYAAGYFVIAGFFTPDSKVQGLFEHIFWLVIISQPINALAFVLDGMYKGLGKTKALRNLLIAATLFGFMPVAVASHYTGGGLLGIWLAFLVWMTVRSGWLLWDFRKKYVKIEGATAP